MSSFQVDLSAQFPGAAWIASAAILRLYSPLFVYFPHWKIYILLVNDYFYWRTVKHLSWNSTPWKLKILCQVPQIEAIKVHHGKPLFVSANRYRTVLKSGVEAITISDLGVVQSLPKKNYSSQIWLGVGVESKPRPGEKNGEEKEEAVQALVLVSPPSKGNSY